MPFELSFKHPSYAAALEAVVYKNGVSASDFSPFETLQKNLIPGCSATVDGDLNLWFNTLFGDGSNFMKDWRKAREDFNFSIPPWNTNDDKSGGTRLFKCTTHVTETIFKKQTPFVEKERYASWSSGGSNFLRLSFSSMTPQVTSGKSFRIETCIEGKEESGTVSVKIYRHIHFMESVVMEGLIKKVAASELQASYVKFISLVKAQMRKVSKKEGVKKPTPAAAVEQPEPSEPDEAPKVDSADDQGVMIAAGFGGLIIVILLLFFFGRSRKSSPGSPYDILLDPNLAPSLGMTGLDDLRQALLTELGHGSYPVEITASRVLQTLIREGEQLQSVAGEADLYVTLSVILVVTSVGLLVYSTIK
eukprot:TRINITY_DN16740_c0_g1_i1.p1 TRINITY_DN16740_c0_g1~~TRINITY_DN16740_c0_g1_i1.p1  ORF type:complete len:362 (+),score=64.97 TRINITY_DN16740_c0_g1_i1:107-1192(+)